MEKVIVIAKTELEASLKCQNEYGWTPDAVREVDSGNDHEKAFMCFESQVDADLWDKQV